MSEWHRRTATLATRGAATQSRHLGVGPGLVDEDELVWIKINLRRKPGFACCRYVSPLLFGSVRCFF
jgi:hypothetical protein